MHWYCEACINLRWTVYLGCNVWAHVWVYRDPWRSRPSRIWRQIPQDEMRQERWKPCGLGLHSEFSGRRTDTWVPLRHSCVSGAPPLPPPPHPPLTAAVGLPQERVGAPVHGGCTHKLRQSCHTRQVLPVSRVRLQANTSQTHQGSEAARTTQRPGKLTLNVSLKKKDEGLERKEGGKPLKLDRRTDGDGAVSLIGTPACFNKCYPSFLTPDHLKHYKSLLSVHRSQAVCRFQKHIQPVN